MSCPCCGSASRIPGQLALHGHGVRERQVRGPDAHWGRPKTLIVAARRFRCQRCAAVILVVPRGVIARRLFAATAIALALWLFGVEQRPPVAVRAAVSPWQSAGATAAAGWAQLRRWAGQAREGRLFGDLPAAADGPIRAVAKRVATAIAAMGPPSAWDASSVDQLWEGALHAAMRISL